MNQLGEKSLTLSLLFRASSTRVCVLLISEDFKKNTSRINHIECFQNCFRPLFIFVDCKQHFNAMIAAKKGSIASMQKLLPIDVVSFYTPIMHAINEYKRCTITFHTSKGAIQ